MSCDSQCSLVIAPGAVGWSAVDNCGIPDHTHFLFCYRFRQRVVGRFH